MGQRGFKGGLTTTRSIRLAAHLLLLLALSTAASLASPAPVSIAAGHSTPVAVCPAEYSSALRRAISTHTRVAFKCRCCGRDENGHCNHQCCD
jgi:hypothetical protein